MGAPEDSRPGGFYRGDDNDATDDDDDNANDDDDRDTSASGLGQVSLVSVSCALLSALRGVTAECLTTQPLTDFIISHIISQPWPCLLF